MPRRLKLAIVFSNLFFWFFIGFGVYYWLQNRSIKIQADQYYVAMLDALQQCESADSTNQTNCLEVRKNRIALDKLIFTSTQYSSLTRLFVIFAIFLTLITWGCFFLTQAIFQ